MMSGPLTDSSYQLDTKRLADALGEFVFRDLDLLYAERRFSARDAPDGPESDARRAASDIAYLASRLLQQILLHSRSMIRFQAEEINRLRDAIDDDVPW